jgi:hypothetical protein
LVQLSNPELLVDLTTKKTGRRDTHWERGQNKSIFLLRIPN